jgi:hypothetical protein
MDGSSGSGDAIGKIRQGFEPVRSIPYPLSVQGMGDDRNKTKGSHSLTQGGAAHNRRERLQGKAQ